MSYWRFAMLFLLLGVTTAGVTEDWPTFHRDNARSGRSTETLVAPTLKVAWATSLSRESVDASPAVVADRIYVGTAEGLIACLNASNGTLIWQYQTYGAVLSSPTVAEGRVFVGSADRCIYALDAINGKVQWRVRTRHPVVASPLYSGGKIYCGSGDGVFRCLAAQNGRLLWQAKEQGEISASACAAADALFYGDEAGNVVARGLDDGKLLWTTKLAGSIVAAPLLKDETILVPVMSGTALSPPATPCLSVLDRHSGERLWAMTKQSSVVHSPVVDEANVYFATVSGYLSDTEMIACRLSDGRELWKRRLGGVADSSPILAGQYLLFGDHDTNFYILDKLTGNVLFTLPIGAKMFSSPALSAGSIYIGAQDGKLYCLR